MRRASRAFTEVESASVMLSSAEESSLAARETKRLAFQPFRLRSVAPAMRTCGPRTVPKPAPLPGDAGAANDAASTSTHDLPRSVPRAPGCIAARHDPCGSSARAAHAAKAD